MKIFVFFPNENWILDRIGKEWRHYRADVCSNEPMQSDIFWFLDNYSWRSIHPQILQGKITVQSAHHIVPDKFNKEEFYARDRYIDHYLCPNKFTKDFIKNHTDKPISVIGYWYNPDLWHREHDLDRDQEREKLGLTSDEFVIGSFQRDTEGHDLISPKLEKGPDLFLKYIKKFDNVHVLLGGWRRQYVINELKKCGIKYTYKEMVNFDSLKRMYTACDLYVVSSRYEGGPQAVLEASSMKVPIVSTNVGMASEVLSENCVVSLEDEA